MMKTSYTEEDVMRACEAVLHGVSYRRAHLDYWVPKTTIRDRIYGTKSHQEAAISSQRLAPVQEKRLTEWVLVQDVANLVTIHHVIKDLLARLTKLLASRCILAPLLLTSSLCSLLFFKYTPLYL
jgi:hypothetical protein